ncbi:MAG: hypothetical protein AAGK37_16500 [Pseudomonadota bacterium]
MQTHISAILGSMLACLGLLSWPANLEAGDRLDHPCEIARLWYQPGIKRSGGTTSFSDFLDDHFRIGKTRGFGETLEHVVMVREHGDSIIYQYFFEINPSGEPINILSMTVRKQQWDAGARLNCQDEE